MMLKFEYTQMKVIHRKMFLIFYRLEKMIFRPPLQIIFSYYMIGLMREKKLR